MDPFFEFKLWDVYGPITFICGRLYVIKTLESQLISDD